MKSINHPGKAAGKIFILASIMALFLLLVVKCSMSPADANDPVQQKTEAAARSALLAHVSNPETVEFRNQIGRCGQFKHRDFYGRASGYRRFIATSGNEALVEAKYDDPAFEHLWTRFCLGQ